MAKTNTFHEYVMTDLLGEVPGITSRAMFGGWGIYQNGIIFGIIANDQLYFKVGESNRESYETAGSHPFVYSQGNHHSTTMSYWLVPEFVLEDQDELQAWINDSVAVSLQSKKASRKK
jgi:DNA transformation protein